MTVDAVRDRIKTVTRRDPDTWRDLKPGDRLTLIEKGMGLKKGEKQVVLAEVEVVSVRVESVHCIRDEEDGTEREGLGHMSPDDFIAFWLEGHRVHSVNFPVCRRIEWRYLDGAA